MARKPAYEVRGSDIQGHGVFATRKIRKDSWLIEYVGEKITHEEADQRYDDESMDRHHTFLFILDDFTCLDASAGGNDARFINHSCEPNCEAVYDEEAGQIWICAARTIQAGEELTYDYGFDVDTESVEEARRLYPCLCGAPTCRGTILKAEQPS